MNFTGDILPGNVHPATPVSFISNGPEANFRKSPTWTYTGFTTAVLEPDYGTSGGQYAYFPQPVVYLYISRQSTGVIYRLAFPIMLMLLLGK